MDYTVIERAGLTQQEFAALINFSRPSVNLWINGHKKPGPRAKKAIDEATRVLSRAVEENHLPTDNEAKRDKLLANIGAWLHGRTQS